MKMKKVLVSMFAAGVMATPLAYATNGMMMEGYGPIATGMGGASMAYDNGAAAMANNPATLGLMPEGTSRLDLAVGGLHPNISATCTAGPCAGAVANSGGTAYYMPAAGWVKKEGGIAYGVGVFAQGGMGTEYTANDWVGAGSGLPSRSEVSVGNLIVPVSFEVSPDFNIAGSLDFVWGGMDLQMAMTQAQMTALGPNLNMTMGGAPFTPAGMAGMGYSVAQFDFSNGSSFTGKANSTGWAGKLGMTYKISPQLTLGATYHSKTSLGDMQASGALVRMIDPAGVNPTQTMTGTVSIVNFQFPEVYGVGMALQASDDLMIAVDYKRLGWAKVMKDFHMTYTSAGIGMGAVTMDMRMPQNWKDQDVFNIGFAYKTTPALTLRAGLNLAGNPVPDNTVNPLFPATITNHATLGFGYAMDKISDINASLTYAPKVSVTSPNGYSIDHSQINWQLMYSHRF